jgi:hypothetical protein
MKTKPHFRRRQAMQSHQSDDNENLHNFRTPMQKRELQLKRRCKTYILHACSCEEDKNSETLIVESNFEIEKQN